MAWTYLQGSAELPSPWAHGSDPSLIVKSTDMLKPSYFQECETEFYRRRLFGTTSPPSTPQASPPQSTSFTAGFHVRTSALQDLARAWRESEAAFFSRSKGSYAMHNQLSFSWKTYPQSVLGVAKLWGKHWPSSGLIVAGTLYQLRKWEHRTCESAGFSLLPTPTASEYGTGNNGTRDGKTKYKNPGRPSLGFMAKHSLWPTPRASPNENRQTKPSPSQIAGRRGMNLSTAVQRWPTPTASEGAKGSPRRKYGDGTMSLSAQVHHSVPSGGQLSPTWVEWLMGYPLGWTALGDWATQWYRPKRAKLSKDSAVCAGVGE